LKKSSTIPRPFFDGHGRNGTGGSPNAAVIPMILTVVRSTCGSRGEDEEYTVGNMTHLQLVSGKLSRLSGTHPDISLTDVPLCSTAQHCPLGCSLKACQKKPLGKPLACKICLHLFSTSSLAVLPFFGDFFIKFLGLASPMEEAHQGRRK
jgi:hypothetical protein